MTSLSNYIYALITVKVSDPPAYDRTCFISLNISYPRPDVY